MVNPETWIVTLDNQYNSNSDSSAGGYLILTGPDRPWEFMTGEITGFTPEPGKYYKILVEKQEIPDPPADGSSIRWRHVQTIDDNVDVDPRDINMSTQQK